MSLKGKSDIFESIAQHYDGIADDPASIRLREDQVLIRELADDEKQGSIIIPEIARGRGPSPDGNLRIGVVVSVGPGNAFIEGGIDENGFIRRRLISDGPCPDCKGGCLFSILTLDVIQCPSCFGTGKHPIRVPTECIPGDRVLFDRRREAQFFFNGEKHYLVYEEQAICLIMDRC